MGRGGAVASRPFRLAAMAAGAVTAPRWVPEVKGSPAD